MSTPTRKGLTPRQHLNNFLRGMGQVLVLWPNSDYIHPEDSGFDDDFKQLRGDVSEISRILTEEVEYYSDQQYLRMD